MTAIVDRRLRRPTPELPLQAMSSRLPSGPTGPFCSRITISSSRWRTLIGSALPERQPHAKGSGAFGRFEVTKDVSKYTKAALFQPGVKTDMLARFLTVAGERAAPDTWRDPRGFALKFYTGQGNYDLVGNNTPVFFIRDGMKFQHFIRSQKRRADNNLRDHDMQWDFWTLSPKSAHQVAWLMGDRGIPRTWRHMDGFSSHTYLWVNAKSEVLGEIPFQDRSGKRVPDPGGGRSRPASTATTTRGISTKRSSAESARAGRCICRSCHSTTPRPIASTRSI